MRGRKLKPPLLKIASGNPGKRKINKAEPTAKGSLPSSPSWLTKTAKAIYDRDAPLFTWLDSGNAEAFAHRCQLTARLHTLERAAGRKSKVHEDRQLLSAIRESQMMIRSLESDLGITAAHRGKVTTPEQGAGDELDSYAKTKGA